MEDHTSPESAGRPAESAANDGKPAARSRWARAAIGLAIAIAAYLIVAYLVMPALWKGYVRHHPAIDETPGITLTGDGHPGDPINVALVGSEADVLRIMRAAGWYRADPLGLRSDLKIAAGT